MIYAHEFWEAASDEEKALCSKIFGIFEEKELSQGEAEYYAEAVLSLTKASGKRNRFRGNFKSDL